MVLIEAAYQKGFSWIPRPLPLPCGVHYSIRIQNALWYGHEKTRKVHVVQEWPWTIFLSINEAFLKQKSDLFWSPGMTVASLVGRQHLKPSAHSFNESEWTLVYPAMAIWLTRHWTTEDILNELAEESYYGRGTYGLNNAAKIYFHKTPDALTDAQIAELLALEWHPGFLKEPKELKRQTQRFLSLIINQGEEKY